jgi:phosphopantetheine--protein transferase-like protein
MKSDIIYAYTGIIPKDIKIEGVYPEERQTEINKAKSERVKREKYCVWKLLEYGIKHALHILINEISFKRSENGKWLTDSFCFSISHSGDMVAVVISQYPVGIDVERMSERLERVMPRILTDNEKRSLSNIPKENMLEYLCTKWVQKESIFKAKDAKAFTPSKIEAQDYKTYISRIDDYFLSICAENVENVRIFNNVEYLS